MLSRGEREREREREREERFKNIISDWEGIVGTTGERGTYIWELLYLHLGQHLHCYGDAIRKIHFAIVKF